MMFSARRYAAIVAAVLCSGRAAAQTYSSCNPTTTTCPADTALGMAIDVDFTQGEVNSFVKSGGEPTYGSDGVTFTVAKSGDAPQLTSVFYIMFGRVEISLKAAPGAGIVSSFVLQSDCLDEIDWEWLGSDAPEVQSNYFGKGITASYNRGRFHQTANTQDGFITYVIDWTSDRVIWTVDGTVVRTLAVSDAEEGQYPQTPMQVKFGVWAGGDPGNPQGTIDWARGPTDYTKGPFSMSVKSVKVTDYSTGSSYSYSGTSGTWQSIQAEGGSVNGNLGNAGTLTTTAVASGSTSTETANVPAGGIGGSSTTGSTTSNLPAGWRMTSEGKIVPSSSVIVPFSQPSSPSPSALPSQVAGGSGLETVTAFDGKGFLTTMTVPAGFATLPKSYDSQGFPVFPTATSVASQPGTTATASNDDANVEAPLKAAHNVASAVFETLRVLVIMTFCLVLSMVHLAF
ncbi:concanavalin A-like lectin/glucanase domain-containing protein [Whalleya microplaca]|nr:concanavalin A-like lectin/glucanase domain-containing protein [Whalleya microplaca]